MGRLDSDKIINADLKEIRPATIHILDTLQNYHPHIQALAVAVVFKLLAERFKQEPQEIFTVVGNMLTRAGRFEKKEFEATRDYLREEL